MNQRRNQKGLTLIALIVSIIILLIIAGISITFVLGEDGIIAQAQEARIMSELSDTMFDIESDVLYIKTEQKNFKLNSNELIKFMTHYMSEKYKYDRNKDNAGIYTYAIIPQNTSFSDLKIAINGDVYLNNYIRGKVELSSNESEIEMDGVIEGKSNIRVIDGNIYLHPDGAVVLEPQVDYKDDSAVMWLNSNSEVMAITNIFGFVPVGLFDYEISCLEMDLRRNCRHNR